MGVYLSQSTLLPVGDVKEGIFIGRPYFPFLVVGLSRT